MVDNQLKELVLLDQNEPYTINTSYMYIFEKYKGPLPELQTASTKTPFSTVKNSADYGDDDDDPLVYKPGSSDAQAVRQMLLSLYSYWKLLTKRFIDYVTLSLRAGCVFTVYPVLQQRLRRIPIEHPDWIDRYLADDDFIRHKRKQYKKTEEILEKVYQILHGDDTIFADDIFSDWIEIPSDSTITSQAAPENSSDITNSDTDDDSPNMSTIIPSSSPQVSQSSASSMLGSSFTLTTPPSPFTFSFGSTPVTTSSPFGFGSKAGK
jgi:hypothetical protein